MNDRQIQGYAKQVVEDIRSLEAVPSAIRYDNPAFQAALRRAFEGPQARVVLERIRKDAYNGQEKEALGERQTKTEALSGELWFGLDGKGLHQIERKQEQGQAIAQQFLRPAGRLAPREKRPGRTSLDRVLGQAENKAGHQDAAAIRSGQKPVRAGEGFPDRRQP